MLQFILLIYFYISNKKLNIKDILIDDTKLINPEKNSNQEIENQENNSLLIENSLYTMVEHGKIDEIKKWMDNVPSIKSGILSTNNLRQFKNMFIVATTLASRAAIKGHMDANEALGLSDLYIQKMELLNNVDDIYILQANMILDYTNRVNKIHQNNINSTFLIKLNKYIIEHISNAIKVNNVCKYLYISKSSLFNKLKKEANMAFSEYVLKIKINEAKNILKHSSNSLLSISLYLGFSSQSHFNHAFKEIVGVTPSCYRNNHK